DDFPAPEGPSRATTRPRGVTATGDARTASRGGAVRRGRRARADGGGERPLARRAAARGRAAGPGPPWGTGGGTARARARAWSRDRGPRGGAWRRGGPPLPEGA